MPRELVIAKDSVVASDDGETFKVTVADDQFTGVITETDLREKYVPKATHEKLQTDVSGRITSAVDTARTGFRTEAIADDDFLSGAIKDRAEYFKERFPKAGEGPNVEELMEAWKVEHVAPMQVRIDERETEIAGLQLEAVRGARSRGINEAGVDPDHASLMEDHLALRTAWSREHNRVVVVDPSKGVEDEGYIVTHLDGADLVPQTVAGYLNTCRESGKFDFAFSAKVKDGGGFGGGGGEGDKENLKDQIARLEGEGKHGEASILKEKQIQIGLGKIPKE